MKKTLYLAIEMFNRVRLIFYILYEFSMHFLLFFNARRTFFVIQVESAAFSPTLSFNQCGTGHVSVVRLGYYSKDKDRHYSKTANH